MSRKPSPSQVREINDSVRYAMWSVFATAEPLDEDRGKIASEVTALFGELEGEGVVIRGVYDVAGLRADADLMIWWHAETIEQLQSGYHRFLRTALGQALDPVWSVAALHRPAEFNKSHVPAFLAGEEPKGYVCVYPFNRSYDWYLIDGTERRDMLVEHGQLAREFPDVRANTISAFALGDYEWILAFEADELHRIVDLMRALRNTEARRHVRVELPFFTGRRTPIGELVDNLP
jgi:peroxiredoxin